MENDTPVQYDNGNKNAIVGTSDEESILLLENEAALCSVSRLKLNVIIAEKILAMQSYEQERIKHNEFLQCELRLDTQRMKIMMRLRRATLREI